MTKKPTHIKNYLKSKSPEALKLKMLENSLKTNCYHDYVIKHDGEFWFAWYEFDAEEIMTKEIQRLANEELNSRPQV